MALDPLTAAFEAGKYAIERIWPDPEKQAIEIRHLEKLRQDGELVRMKIRANLLIKQMDTNKQEASHKSVFVAGYRPFIGWVCGFGLLYVSTLEPILRFIALLCGYTGKFPVIDTSLTMQILMGMLGIAGMRSYDKKNKTQTDKIIPSESN